MRGGEVRKYQPDYTIKKLKRRRIVGDFCAGIYIGAMCIAIIWFFITGGVTGVR